MKTIAIPAQITTVEDRIAGNLNLTQLLLLAVPLFATALIFFLLPPIGRFALYKVIVAAVMVVASSSMAIRIDEKLVLEIVKIRTLYRLRPHIYTYSDDVSEQTVLEFKFDDKFDKSLTKQRRQPVVLSARARRNSQLLLLSRQHNVSFESDSGGLNVKVSTL